MADAKEEDTSTTIYKVPGRHRGPKGTTYSSQSADAGGKTPDGWHKTLDAAVDAYLPKAKPGRKAKAKTED